jgi:hypothetical protein
MCLAFPGVWIEKTPGNCPGFRFGSGKWPSFFRALAEYQLATATTGKALKWPVTKFQPGSP